MTDLSQFHMVLLETSHPGNIGSTARAMKTMGFQKLILVNPKHFPHEDATAFASGATDILQHAKVTRHLSEALLGMQHVVGVSARLRDVPLPCMTPREFVHASVAHQDLATAIIFGNEQSGLSNTDLSHCHLQIQIPTAKDYGSLNLAQAVQVICYEIAQAVRAAQEEDGPHGQGAGRRQELVERMPASQEIFEGMFAHWCEVLEACHYLHPQQRQKMLLRMRQLWLRASPSETEVTMMRGAFRNILRCIPKPLENIEEEL